MLVTPMFLVVRLQYKIRNFYDMSFRNMSDCLFFFIALQVALTELPCDGMLLDILKIVISKYKGCLN